VEHGRADAFCCVEPVDGLHQTDNRMRRPWTQPRQQPRHQQDGQCTEWLDIV
jgi:hypothetical protein